MKILNDSIEPGSPKIATIGFFDGVHLGHQYLLRQLRKLAGQYQLESLVVTFREHPLQVLKPDYTSQLLTTLPERLDLLAQQGVDDCFLLNFSSKMAHLTAAEFMHSYLKEKLNVKMLLMGHDHHFGSERNLVFEDYQRLGETLGITVMKAEKFSGKTDESISSSVIRNYIRMGQFEKVTQLLSRPFQLSGSVVTGQQLGRTIGFPTANIYIGKTGKIIPAEGVYAVKVKVGDRVYKGMANFGHKPTVNHTEERNLEIHIFDFNQNIYGQEIDVLFYHFIRQEQTFSSIDTLQKALQHDQQVIEAYFQ